MKDVPVLTHAPSLRALIVLFLQDHPNATFEEIKGHVDDNGYMTVDIEMFREWLTKEGLLK